MTGGSSGSGLPRHPDGRPIEGPTPVAVQRPIPPVPPAPVGDHWSSTPTRRTRYRGKRLEAVDHRQHLGEEPRLRPEELEMHDEPEPDVAEESIPRALTRPIVKRPARSEIIQHELTHVPYRPWCDVCTAARAISNPHRRRPQ